MNALEAFRSKPRAEQVKLALVPVLVIGLGAVLYGQMAGPPSDGSSNTVAVDQPGAANVSASQVADRGGDEATALETTPWKLEDVIALNPFRGPSKPAEDETTELIDEEPMVEIQPDGDPDEAEDDEPAITPKPPRRWPAKVQAVFMDERGAAAIVDSKVVRIGDVMSDGAKVVEISTNAVTFELGGEE